MTNSIHSYQRIDGFNVTLEWWPVPGDWRIIGQEGPIVRGTFGTMWAMWVQLSQEGN